MTFSLFHTLIAASSYLNPTVQGVKRTNLHVTSQSSAWTYWVCEWSKCYNQSEAKMQICSSSKGWFFLFPFTSVWRITNNITKNQKKSQINTRLLFCQDKWCGGSEDETQKRFSSLRDTPVHWNLCCGALRKSKRWPRALERGKPTKQKSCYISTLSPSVALAWAC